MKDLGEARLGRRLTLRLTFFNTGDECLGPNVIRTLKAYSEAVERGAVFYEGDELVLGHLEYERAVLDGVELEAVHEDIMPRWGVFVDNGGFRKKQVWVFLFGKRFKLFTVTELA